jgi:hypothetical protein
LIVGDEKKTLTNAMWREGKTYWDATKSVETWMGICHGWAPASFMMGRPKHSVNVLAADGKTKVTFFPSDIKALESLLWANGSFKQKLMGTRCTSKKPRSDSNGRMIGQDCFDNNPGSFHLAITNQIGIAGKKTNGFEKRGLVLDATFDYEVWNHPIYGYKYSYTNAQTGKSVGSISAAAVTPTEFTKDKFKKYRSPKAVKIVGIAMDVTYMIETQPSTSDSNSPDDDLETTVRYLYDLEIDNSGEIIGGEWYSNAHPDFLWTASEGTQAKSFVDSSLSGTWEDKDSVPKQWQSLAPKASFYSQPIAKIIQEIVERAQ